MAVFLQKTCSRSRIGSRVGVAPALQEDDLDLIPAPQLVPQTLREITPKPSQKRALRTSSMTPKQKEPPHPLNHIQWLFAPISPMRGALPRLRCKEESERAIGCFSGKFWGMHHVGDLVRSEPLEDTAPHTGPPTETP